MHLVDLLVSLALLGLVLAGTVTVLHQGQLVYAIGSARVESQQAARVALARMAREIRQAGVGGAGLAAVAAAEPARIVLHMDVNGDGRIAGRGETITWRLAGSVLRRDAGGGAQPIVNGVRALALGYLDARGLPTAAPADVRTVVITLTTGPDRPVRVEAAGALTTVSTQVRLRNR